MDRKIQQLRRVNEIMAFLTPIIAAISSLTMMKLEIAIIAWFVLMGLTYWSLVLTRTKYVDVSDLKRGFRRGFGVTFFVAILFLVSPSDMNKMLAPYFLFPLLAVLMVAGFMKGLLELQIIEQEERGRITPR